MSVPGSWQRVWWGWGLLLRQWPWRWIHSNGPFPVLGPNRGCIYDRRIVIGPVEYRRWSKPKEDK